MIATLRSIAPVDLGDAEPAVPKTGMPIFELARPADLYVDPAYQRDLGSASLRHIRKIASEFDWADYTPPKCAMEEVDGRTVLKVIDGQHTAIAAASNPHIDQIPIMIIEAPEQASQAAAFISHNTNRLSVTATQLHAAAVTAGDEDALTVQQVCQRAGVTILKFNPGRAFRAGETLAIAAVRSLVAKRSAMRARVVLEALVQAGRAPILANDIKAADLLLSDAEYSAEIDAEMLTAAIIAAGAGAEQDAKVFAAAHSVPFWKALAVVWFKKKRNRARAVAPSPEAA